MIRHEPLPEGASISLLRMYTKTSSDPFEPFDVVRTAIWERPDAVWIAGMRGIVTRALLLDLLDFLISEGVQIIKAKRADSRSLPMGTVMPDGHTEIRVSDLVNRFRAS